MDKWHIQATWGFVQVRQDIEAISNKSLLCFSSGGRNTYGLLFLNFIFCNFIGLRHRADSHKFRTCTKPYRNMQCRHATHSFIYGLTCIFSALTYFFINSTIASKTAFEEFSSSVVISSLPNPRS